MHRGHVEYVENYDIGTEEEIIILSFEDEKDSELHPQSKSDSNEINNVYSYYMSSYHSHEDDDNHSHSHTNSNSNTSYSSSPYQDSDKNSDCTTSKDESQCSLDFTLLGDSNMERMGIDDLDKLITFYQNDRAFASMSPSDSSIRLLSWNILADGERYALSSRHNYVPLRLRCWDYRSIRIYASIAAHYPDIVLLQEVTDEMYTSCIKPWFQSIGYNTLHLNKTKDSLQTIAILYQSARFRLIKHEVIHLKKVSALFGDSVFGPQNTMFRSSLNRMNNVAVALLFRDEKKSSQFIVVSTHLYWNPERPQIKSAQMFALNQYLIHILTRDISWRVDGSNIDYDRMSEQEIMDRIPMIFACDANSVSWKACAVGPQLFSKSGVNQIMSDGTLDVDHLDHPVHQYNLRYIRSKQCLYGQLEYNVSIAHQQIELMQCIKAWKLSSHMSWKSVYNEYMKKYYQSQDDEAIFTNKVSDFCDTIDYIYFNKAIKLIAVLKMPYETGTGTDSTQTNTNLEPFNQFRQEFRDQLAKIKAVRRQWTDELLFCGLFRDVVECHLDTNINIQTQTEIIRVFKLYFCTQSQYSKMIMTHDEFIYDQSFWRMLYNLDQMEMDPESRNIHCNAWSYPLMPNRKDPSDHFPLCCDFEVT